MSNLIMIELKDKALKLYEKIPKQHQRYHDEMEVALGNMVNEYNVLYDKEAAAFDKLEKTTAAYENLKWEFDELTKEYHKLNKKLNNDLIK